jgi:hypothetical protein
LFKKVDDELEKWVGDTLDQQLGLTLTPTFEPPTKQSDRLGVNLYLLELMYEPRLARSNRPYPQPALRYLVTTYGGDQKQAHELLGVLLWASFNKNRIQTNGQNPAEYVMEVDLEPVGSHIWSAFGIEPRPSFMLRVLVPHDWLGKSTPIVTQRPIPEQQPLTNWHGRLWLQNGGERTPFRGVRVEHFRPYRQSFSDSDGFFTVPSVLPIDAVPPKITLSIHNRYELENVPLAGPAAAASPTEITLAHLYGRLVRGPQKEPLAGALVHLKNPERLVHTDQDGRFIIPVVPLEPHEKSLIIQSGRTQSQAVNFTGTGSPQHPVEIEL